MNFGGGVKIREGVAPDRRVSVEDGEMRHGRKSKSKRFNGYRRHIATDLDSDLILAGAITPANRPEEEAAPELKRYWYSLASRLPCAAPRTERAMAPVSDRTWTGPVIHMRIACAPWSIAQPASLPSSRQNSPPSCVG